MFFRWRLDPVLVPKMETIFYIPSCYSKLDPSATQVFQNISRRWMHLCALILKPPKGTQPFKYVIAQFLSNMELYLSAGECNGLHRHRRNWIAGWTRYQLTAPNIRDLAGSLAAVDSEGCVSFHAAANWHGRRESHPHKAVLETAALLMYHVRKMVREGGC